MKSIKHECRKFLQPKKATQAFPYKFVNSGLPNVYLSGIHYFVCSKCGNQTAELPAVLGLLDAITLAIVEKNGPLSGSEILFLRTHLGLRAADFAVTVGVTPEQVSRWENGHNPPEKSADKLIRLLVCARSNLSTKSVIQQPSVTSPTEAFHLTVSNNRQWQLRN